MPLSPLAAQQLALRRAIVEGRDGGAPGCRGLLRIYQQAYTARLTAALRDNVGVLPRVMGDEAFDALALAYIDAHPSQRPSIRWFGHRLPAFMALRDDLVPHPAIVDLAAMEWALRDAFDAADAEPLESADLAAVPAEDWPSLVFRPMPGLTLLPLQWNVGPVWRALQADGQDVELPEPDALDHTLLIWRRGLTPQWRALDPLDASLLCDAIDGRPFAALCERLADASGSLDEATARVVGSLRGWIADGLFRRLGGGGTSGVMLRARPRSLP